LIIQAPVKIRSMAGVDRESRPKERPGSSSSTESLNSNRTDWAAEVVIRVEDLRKSFRSGFLKRRIPGIEGVSFTVNRGMVFALIGHNGAGKTTTINCILDLVHADGGQVSIMGKSHRDPISRAKVGYLPERPFFFEHLSGRELLRFYAKLLGMSKDRSVARIDEVLNMVGMTELAGRRLQKYSKGMLQRIGLAQAILGDPELLILDEPMSGLDPIGRREVREILMDLKHAGKTIILSSHIVQDVEMIADTVGVLKQGCLVAMRNLTELNSGFSYTGDLALTQPAPAWLPDGCSDLGDGKVRVPIESVTEMRDLLNNCHREAISVVSLATHRSCLEEMFMEINSGFSTAREVVR
jgi:ABC-2 type transport system ATP-binding protein